MLPNTCGLDWFLFTKMSATCNSPFNLHFIALFGSESVSIY